jgi:hypothetical protein
MIISQTTSQNWKNQEKKANITQYTFSIKFIQLIHIINSNAYPLNVPPFSTTYFYLKFFIEKKFILI